MRETLALMLFLIVVLVGCFTISSWSTGAYFERRYYEYLQNYNLTSNIKVNILSYKRGWFSSEAVLNAEIIHPQKIQLLTLLGINPAAIPRKYTINQHIKHGPIVYRPDQSYLFVMGLAAIDYEIVLSDEIKKIFHIYNPQNTYFVFGENIINFGGSYYTSFQCDQLNASTLNIERKVQFDQLSGNFWTRPYPIAPRITGEINAENVSFVNDGNAVSAPHILIHFSQQHVGDNFYFDISAKRN
ncbi:MAG: DUF945 family protein [Gammaproteobacteria bacterium]|nr:DUF945 family protein [Gammaproteobacteria bacterium]